MPEISTNSPMAMPSLSELWSTSCCNRGLAPYWIHIAQYSSRFLALKLSRIKSAVGRIRLYRGVRPPSASWNGNCGGYQSHVRQHITRVCPGYHSCPKLGFMDKCPASSGWASGILWVSILSRPRRHAGLHKDPNLRLPMERLYFLIV